MIVKLLNVSPKVLQLPLVVKENDCNFSQLLFPNCYLISVLEYEYWIPENKKSYVLLYLFV